MSSKILKNFQKTIERLEEVLLLKRTKVNRDSAIKRFELCFDLCWKLIKIWSKKQGIECNSPRSCFKTAFQLHLIDYEKKYLKMIDDRNLTVHLYEEKHADQVYSRLKDYLKLFKKLSDKIKKL